MDNSQRREFKEADRVDSERARAFEELIETKGWQLLMQLAFVKHDSLVQEMLRPLGDSVNAALVQEYNKGTMYGLQWLLGVPESTINSMKAAKQAEQAGGDTDDVDDDT